MDLQARQALTRKLSRLYRKVPKKTRGKVLDSFVLATGYHRTHASWLLLHPPSAARKKHKRHGKSRYALILPPLTKIWGFSNFASGKRLVGMIPSYVETLTRDHELVVSEKDKELLLKISAATIERMIKPERKKV